MHLSKVANKSVLHRYGGAKIRILTLPRTELPKWLRNRWTARRIVATPPWAVMGDIRAAYAKAAMMTETTGVKYVVDHVIPLAHPRVCGLHVAGNLRVVLDSVNGAKGNDWCPEQMDLIPGWEQLRIL